MLTILFLCWIWVGSFFYANGLFLYAEGLYFYAEGFYFYAEGLYFYAEGLVFIFMLTNVIVAGFYLKMNCRGALVENVIIAGLSKACNCRKALLEGRRLTCAYRFNSSALTHFVNTCAYLCTQI